MRKHFNLTICGIAFCGLATTSAFAFSREGLEAVRKHMECVADKTAKVDNGRMTAQEIAKIVQPLCHSEHEAAMLASMPEKWRSLTSEQSQDLEFAHTEAAVEWAKGPK